MELTITREDGYVLGRTRGPIDEAAGVIFRDQLHPLVGEPGTKLVLDISGTERINSIGISHLVRLVSDANTNGSRVILAGAKPFVSSVLAITRLDKFFDLASDVSSAVALLSAT